ncbi:MAG: L-seryl-tRNA(Sec) selenium transferase [Acidobacteriota bacterium]|nr:L-seryl-tRNA(Sec) selenium transferase [Acidobacteriota bacterium]
MEEYHKREILRRLPSIDALLHSDIAAEISLKAGAKHLTTLARTAIGEVRRKITDGENENQSREDLLSEAATILEKLWRGENNSALRRVINATGVIVHTNLGRAPLSEKARRALVETAFGYCNLEYDIAAGKRGKRGKRAEQLLAELTGAESALIVNNCAAAAFLILTVLAKGGEVVISRGELVEIGGDFRIPDVLEQSGATLREVGATNRTRLADYEKAANENTKLFLKVHPSNYRIVGFTETPELKDLAKLAHQKGVLLYEDAGSGAMFDLSKYGLTDEPVAADSIKAGADIVSFSGDKLLGGAQSGLIVGRAEVIERIRKHPLYRALRVDKLIYAAIEATLEAFRRETALTEIPVLRMISMTESELKDRAKKFVRKLEKNSNLQIEIVAGNSVIGGGSSPTVQLPTTLITLKHAKMSADELEKRLRLSEPPIITRILEDKVLLDLRTVSENEETEMSSVLKEF